MISDSELLNSQCIQSRDRLQQLIQSAFLSGQIEQVRDRKSGARAFSIRVDPDNIDPDELEAKLKQIKHAAQEYRSLRAREKKVLDQVEKARVIRDSLY